MKEGLARMPNIQLYTPRDENLSAGIVCFDVKGMKPEQVVKRLLDQRIVASTTPYRVSYARVACSVAVNRSINSRGVWACISADRIVSPLTSRTSVPTQIR